MEIDLKLVEKARKLVAHEVAVTPLEHSSTMSAMVGNPIYLKLENHQFTASFKERGAYNRLVATSTEERGRGIIAMSAGNHAQAVAYHAQKMQLPTTIVMPRTTPIAKIQATRVFRPELVLEGHSYDETIEYVRKRQRDENLTLIHPFDDPLIIAGQGTLGLEVLDQLPSVDTMIVPIGGGGLISGIAIAAKTLKPQIRLVGVQSEMFDNAYAQFKEQPDRHQRGTSVAEGIAVKQPGKLTMPIIERFVDDIVTVSEGEIETAIFRLLEFEKTLAEGAGAAALAAVMANSQIAQGNTVVVVSGGNIDMSTLASVIQRSLVRTKRILRLRISLEDVPGALTELTTRLGEMDSNIIDIFHRRSFGDSTVGATVVEMVIQLRGDDQQQALLEHLRSHNYGARVLND